MAMTLLLDTNAWSKFLNKKSSTVQDRMAAADPQTLRLCSIVKAELLYGAFKGPNSEKKLSVLEDLFARVASLPFDDRAAAAAARARADLAAKGALIGPHDLLIAGIALASNVTLVTHNLREFSRIEGLRLLDWEA